MVAACAIADKRVMVNWFPMALKGDAQAWLFNLPKCSIKSWRELKNVFLGAFHGGFKRPGIMADLHSQLLSLSLASLDIISGPLIRKKNALVSLAIALAMR